MSSSPKALAAAPLADPQIRAAALRLPRLVLAHERRIFDIPHVTHAICEWAMDEHLKLEREEEPGALLLSETKTLAEAAARTFRCPEPLARRGILFLACAERTLRASRLPRLCRYTVSLIDRDMRRRFDAYVRDATALVRQIDVVLNGTVPRRQPEPDQVMRKEAPAMSAPSAPPAITSLG